MKLLLVAVNAKYIHSNPAVYSLKAYAGAYSKQKSAASSESCEIEIAEFTINQDSDEILKEIYQKAPGVLCFSCYIWNLSMIEKLLADLPVLLPDTDIWLGGPEVSYDAPQFLRAHPQVRGIIRGEGEAAFAQLAALYGRTAAADRPGMRVSDIRGLTYRGAQEEIRENPAQPLLAMDDLPFLYRDLDAFENRIVYYESSRGCPFSCSYCLSSIDKNVRFRSAARVTEELQIFLDHRVPQVKFVDRTFNCRHSHALTIWHYIREHDNGVTNFHFEIAAELLNEEELELLSTLRPGLVQLEIGVQSTNPRTLREIDRTSDFKKLSGIVRRLQSANNIHLHLDLIAGLPYEDYQSFAASFNDVYGLHPHQLQLGFLKVLKGSAMRERAAGYGLCSHARPVYEVLSTKWLSYGEILQLKAVEEMLEIYYNSGQFAHTMARLEREFAHPFAMYRALADYYERQKLLQERQSRQARFDILRAFIKTVSDAPVYEELLLFDLYLRENSKNRPAWAADFAGEKKRMLEFYQREERQRTYLPGYEGRSAKQLMHMAHLEKFSYQMPGAERQSPCWILFDYQKRDPLTADARIADVTAEFIENT